MAAVRETSPLGPCNVLGPLVRETKTRFVYCPHPGQIAFARRSPRIHLEPCKGCPDHPASRYGHLLRAAPTIEAWPMRAMWFWADASRDYVEVVVGRLQSQMGPN